MVVVYCVILMCVLLLSEGLVPTPKPTKHSGYVGQLLHIMQIFSNILKSCHSVVFGHGPVATYIFYFRDVQFDIILLHYLLSVIAFKAFILKNIQVIGQEKGIQGKMLNSTPLFAIQMGKVFFRTNTSVSPRGVDLIRE